MVRAIVALLTVGLVGFAVTGVVFSLVLPLFLLALKIFFFCAITYLILRMVNPGLAESLRSRCCGTRD